MNIAHITESTGTSGGIEQAILLIYGLRRNGHNITLITQPESEIKDRLAGSGIKIKTIKMRQDYDIFSALSLRKFLKDEKIEILHSHHPRAHSIGLLATLGLKNIKFVVTRRVIFNLRKNIFSRFKYKSGRIDRYIVVSEAVKKNFLDYGIDGRKIEVIYSSTDINKFNPDVKSNIRRELKIPGSTFICCLVGNYSYYKGHTFFLEAVPEIIKNFPGTKFLIAGKITDELKNKAENLNIENDVFFLGYRSDIAQILKASNLLVCPSLEEGLAGAIREAMALELPVVATNVGGNPEIVKHNETGILIEPKSTKAISDAVIYLIKNPAAAKKMGEAGRAAVVKNFSVETMISRHEKLYAELKNEYN